MNDKETMISGLLGKLRSLLLADGRIDMAETAWLLKAILPYEEQLGDDFRAFVALLRDVRDDGVITPEESERLIAAMNGLSGLGTNPGNPVPGVGGGTSGAGASDAD